jgi:glycosyltransferase involved in cell wall biosynthesis
MPEDEQRAPELSAIVLGYRAGGSLLRVAEPLRAELEASGVPYELVLVANYWPGRDDETPAVAEEFARAHDRVRVVARPKEGAMGWDMRSGFEAARGEVLIALDGDAQNPVSDVLRMYRALRETGSDVMKGRRVLRHDGPYRRLVSVTYNVLFRVFFGTRGLWDINGKPKAITRAAYERLDLRSDDWFIDAEIVLGARALGLTTRELPVEFFRNADRASLVRPSAIWEFARNMVRVRLRR